MTQQAIPRARLGDMEVLDSGAFGTVHRLTHYRIKGVGELAYKAFTTPLGPDEVANLRALMDFRDALDAGSRAALDIASTWPLRLVTDGGAVCGFVMALIRPEFFATQLLPSKRTASVPVKGQWLVVETAKADASHIPVPAADDTVARLVLCAKLAHVIGVLHRHGLVYGDLSLNNVVFSAAAPPSVMLVDCDAVQSPHGPRVAQHHTDDWMPPEALTGHRIQDLESDRYKLALFILRALTPGPHACQTVDPDRVLSVFDLHGNTMMRDALSTDRTKRPTAKQWYAYLTGMLAELTSPPVFTEVGVEHTVVPVGAPVTVTWQVRGAAEVTVTAADGHRRTCAAADGRCRIAVARSGPFVLTAENRHGTTTVDTESVVALTPPTISRIDIAPIILPRNGISEQRRALEGLERAARGLAPVPSVPVVPVPSIRLPKLPFHRVG